MGPTRLVIDCDPGVDDAASLALAVDSAEIDLLAVTTVSGNMPVDLTTDNALRILQAFDRDDVPVAPGADRPLIGLTPTYPGIHGENGLGGLELPPSARGDSGENAVELLSRILRAAAPGSITIAAIGPLTNIALLLAIHPDLADRIGLLTIMGGSLDRGNITPYAEFNVWADPEAAHRVLVESDLPVRLFTLWATRRATLDDEQCRALAARSPRGELLAEMVRGYRDVDPAGGRPLHDALVIASLIDPSLVNAQTTALAVDTSHGVKRGRTEIESENGSKQLEVVVDADSTGFRELLMSRV
ncbi:MAG: nucleoside hydrolase [Solirubrobacterales bacterium]